MTQSSPTPDTVWVQIVKWKKYNEAEPRVKATSWFRMEHDWLEHPDFVTLDASQCLLWSYLLGKACPKLLQKGVIYISLEHARFNSKMSTTDRVYETLKYFVSKNLIRLLSSPREAVFDDETPKRDEAKKDTENPDVPAAEGNPAEPAGPISDEPVPNESPPCGPRVADTSPTCGHPRDETRRDEERDFSDEKSSSPTPSRRRPAISPRDLARLWNETAHPNMRRVDLEQFKADSGRWQTAKARLRTKPDLAYWRQVIERLNASPFWRGEVDAKDGGKPFVGNFDTLVRRDTHLKALEGRYDGHTQAPAKGGSSYPIFTGNVDDL